MSNPDLPGPYWQEPADSDYRSDWQGDRNGSSYGGNGYGPARRGGAGRSGRSNGSNGSNGNAYGQDGYSGRSASRGSRAAAKGGSRSRGRRASGPAERDEWGYPTGNGDNGYTDGRGWRSRIGRGDGRTAGADNGGKRGRSMRLGPWSAHIADAGDGDYSGAGGIDTMQREREAAQRSTGRARAGSRTAITGRPGRAGGSGGRGGGRGTGGRGWQSEAPRSGGERFKHWLKSGAWWRHWTWKKAIGVCFGFFALLVLAGFGLIFIKYESTPIPTAETALLQGQSSQVYFSNGKLLGTFTNGGFSHEILQTGQIPTVMDQAMVAAEDRHFWTEGGVSIPGTIRAGLNDLFGHGNEQGASTITEQYVKNYYQQLSSEASTQSVGYKIDEVIVALKIAHERSKSWILTQYLNTAPFGPQTYGVGAAAQQYFNINLTKPGTTLSVARAAMLAAIPNSPGVLMPYPDAGVGYTMLVSRWQYVLHYMVVDGAISQQTATDLCEPCALPQAEKVFNKAVKVIPPGSNTGSNGTRNYLMTMVEQELEGEYHYSRNYIDTAGLKIYTTFNQTLLAGLSHAVAEAKAEMRADGGAFPWYAHVGAVLEDPHNGAILAIYGGPGVSLSKRQCKRLQCWNDSAEVPHQAGSSYKPYVLAAAVHAGMNTQTSILNGYSPLCVPPDTMSGTLSIVRGPTQCINTLGPKGYWYSIDTSFGPVNTTKAAAVSSNTAFEDLAHKVGNDNILAMAKALGVGQDPFNQYGENDLTNAEDTFGLSAHGPNAHAGSITLALGASGSDLTAVEQANTFATLVNDGTAYRAHVIARVMHDGKNVTLANNGTQALSPAAAADEDYALSQDNTPMYGGTAYPSAAWPNRPVIGKTGTTNTAQDAWFIGAIPQYSLAVTMYTNDQNSSDTSESLNGLPRLPGPADSGGFGGAWPATVWDKFMTTQFANLPVKQLPTPNFNGFTKWVQVRPQKKKQVCPPWQRFRKNCNPNCPPGVGNGHGHGAQCITPTPNPSTSCTQQFPGQPCGSPSPSPSPSTSCQLFPGQSCSPSPGTGAKPSAAPRAGQLAEAPAALGLLALPPLLILTRRRRGMLARRRRRR